VEVVDQIAQHPFGGLDHAGRVLHRDFALALAATRAPVTERDIALDLALVTAAARDQCLDRQLRRDGPLDLLAARPTPGLVVDDLPILALAVDAIGDGIDDELADLAFATRLQHVLAPARGTALPFDVAEPGGQALEAWPPEGFVGWPL